VLELLRQVVGNLRANRLRSFLTMFGILWGVIAVVVLAATGDGFQRGNQHVLEELGRNVAIVWGGQTSAQAGGQRAGRNIRLTYDDARALARESAMIAVVSAELERNNVRIRSRYNATNAAVHGVEPQYQQIRTLDIERGRGFRFTDDEQALRVAVIGADLSKRLFQDRDPVGARLFLNGIPYDVVGRIRKKDQEDSYSGPDNDKVFIPYHAAARDFPRIDAPPGVVSNIVVAPQRRVVAGLNQVFEQRTGRVEDIRWPLEQEVRRILSHRQGFAADDPSAIWMWDTTISSLMFDRMIQRMKTFFSAVGLVTLALGGVGVMNIMLVAVRERTREIGVRRAAGATRADIQRQFFLEGFLLTMLSGLLGLGIAVAMCAAVNMLPMPTNRFQGMIVTWTTGLLAVAALVVVGIITSTLPARRAAQLPPVDALRYEM
jgi:putative ABC transport system permease protein